MDTGARRRLVEIMRKLACRDDVAVFELHDEFGGNIAAALRRELIHFGIYRVDGDDLAGLVTDACFAIAGCASAWDSDGGALPWVWAGRRVAKLASGYVGQFADPYDAELHDVAVYDRDSSLDDEVHEYNLLKRLAASDEMCALVVEALDRVLKERDRNILLEFRVQQEGGDPSPAHTVAVRHNMKPDAVRKAVSRAKQTLRTLADIEERYAPIADITLVA